ncbi:RNA polymerase II mediator complex component Med8 [Ascosphaera apis ARSEF 7405]|uniref:Mediator of RNA polymerase II transcription subunit 8 n=1 Tax=Ascosphaera apis ARSEF 7405 TaxID=392613 RepID=A0A162I809_9EURO|nr:RNA polymerase II mediator complex component Med8 [Ascosphaera apis ARSEF 7405]
MSALSQEQLKSLETTRLRLQYLTSSINALIDTVYRSDPMPEWSSLQSRAAIISNNLTALSQHLSDNSNMLSTLLAYPTPAVPNPKRPEDRAVLAELMRTKLGPSAEEWIEKGQRLGGGGDNNGDADQSAAMDSSSIHSYDYDYGHGHGHGHAHRPNTKLNPDDLKKLWRFAPIEANRLARQRNWGGDYTLEEQAMGIENVVTGLKHKYYEDDDSDEDEDMDMIDEEASDSDSSDDESLMARDPMLPVEEIFKFMTMGVPPTSRETPASRDWEE